MPYRSIPPHPEHPEQECLPPCGGSWVRNADGSLTPADDATAQAAGLLVEEPPAAPAKPATKTSKE